MFPTEFTPLVIVLLIIILALLVVLVVILAINSKYKNFVNSHSVALKNLREINANYHFKKIDKYAFKHSYDNENFYSDILCQDYLTYQLIYTQKRVKDAMKDTADNRVLYEDYKNEMKDKCGLERFDTLDLLRNKNKLFKYEKQFMKKETKCPTTIYTMYVELKLTRINGAYRDSKSRTFSAKEIEDIITKLNQKRNGFYTNNDIWQSICRVERGKVSNKMRFAIYERDHYRCKKCGRRTNDLEVDHIIPIAKGGKSTFNNLQTLCHRCNARKGTNIDF